MKNVIVFLLFFSFSFILNGCDDISTLNQTSEITTSISTDDVESDLDVRLNQIYELALESNSFDGTYEEWLESIQGPKGEDGKEVLFQVSNGYIQWQYTGDTEWIDLIDLATLTGADGVDGTDGTDGSEVLFQVSNGFIQWQYSGDTEWVDLIDLATLTGSDGVDGKEVLFQVSNGFIQWQYTGDTEWIDLIDLATLTGADGTNGTDGTNGEDGKEVLFQVSNGFIQWQYTGDIEWTNLIDLATLTGADGTNGTDGTNGVDGKEVLFQVSNGYIQWQYTGDTEWIDLIDLATLTGADGTNGTDGTNGEDGKEVLFQVSNGFIQWQYTGDTEWINLIEINTLTGKQGIGIQETTINESGELIIKYTDDTEVNLGIPVVLYTVQFKDEFGNVIDVQNLPFGSDATPPSVPQIDGYTFNNWNGIYENINSNVEVIANYDKNIYSVIFNPNGGSEVDSLTNIQYMDKVQLPIPEKEGYEFKGWYLDETVNGEQFFNTTPVVGNVNLYAKWELLTYKVVYYDHNDDIISVQDIKYGSSAIEPTPEKRYGYIYKGWDQSAVSIVSNLDIYPIYVIDDEDMSKYFTDDNLLNEVYTLVGKNQGDYLTKLELLTVINLNTSKIIENLEGLEYLHNLETIDLKNSPITDASALDGLSNLLIIILNNTELDHLDFVENKPNLKFIGINFSNVTDLSPVSELPSLETLVLTSAPVEDLTPLQNLPVLHTLNLSETNVYDLTPVLNIETLKYLMISGTEVVDISGISVLSDLTWLDLIGNDLASFEELSLMPQLEYLFLIGTGFTLGDVAYVQDLKNLKELKLGQAMFYEVGNLDQLPITTRISIWGFDTHPLLDHRYYALETMLNHIKLVIQESNSDIEKLLRIHDYINKISVSDDLASVNIIDLLIDGKGMCSTYTNATTILLAMQGIESVAVGGSGHAWNVVTLDGQCYHMDGYWNESYGYDYFMISDDTINSYRSGPMFDWMSPDSDKAKPEPCISTLYEPLASFLDGFSNTDDVYLLDTEIIYYDDINQQVKSLSYDLTIENVIVSDVDVLLNVKDGIISYLSTTDDFVRTMNIDGTGVIVIEELMVLKESSLIQNAIKASVENPYLLTFNHEITSVDASKIYYVDQFGDIVTAEVTYNLNVLTITPSESLNSQSEYDLVLLSGSVSNATHTSTNQEIHRYFFTESIPEPYTFTIEHPTDYELEYFQYFSFDRADNMTIFLNSSELITKNMENSSERITIEDSSGDLLEGVDVSFGVYDSVKVALEIYQIRDQLQVGESYTIRLPRIFFISMTDGAFAEEDFVITVTIVDEFPND